MFNGKRLVLARERRGLSGAQLSKLTDLSPITLSRLENGTTEDPSDNTISRLSRALNYPRNFFFKDAPDRLESDTVSFRSLKKMSAGQRNAALGAGAIGLELFDWLEQKYNIPKPDFPDMRDVKSAESAARLVRQAWGLGERPIGNILRLLESRGARILSLEEQNQNVDAFSFWKDDKPYIFLNTFKSAERSIFDCCHELGHLILHRHGDIRPARDVEKEADQFASAFLMPEDDVKNVVAGHIISVKNILVWKARWKVSAMALTYRLHRLKILSDWQYRSFCIDLGRIGYRSAEIIGIERETSTLWEKILRDLWSNKLTKADIANQLDVPHDEIEKLLFGLIMSNTPTRARGALLKAVY